MSYGSFERRARDATRPHVKRLAALKSCLESYHPIGWEASNAYLRLLAGPVDRDPAALDRALDLLRASRDLLLAERVAYAEQRRAAKGEGRRQPGKRNPEPWAGWGWRGDERRAALFALGYERRMRANVDPELADLVNRCLKANGELDAADRALLAKLTTSVEHYRGRGVDRADPDWLGWARSRDAERLLRHLRVASG